MRGRVRRFEIGCTDKEKTAAFYQAVLGWEVDANFHVNSGPDSIPGQINALGHEPHRYVTVYIEVDDMEAALARVRARGGQVLVPTVKLPHGSFAWIGDPDGNIIALWEDHQS